MSNILPTAFVVVALHEFWRRTDLIKVGTVLEVTRQERGNLVSAGIARDGTAEEIATLRGLPVPAPSVEKVQTYGEALELAQATAQAQLAALEAEETAPAKTAAKTKAAK